MKRISVSIVFLIIWLVLFVGCSRELEPVGYGQDSGTGSVDTKCPDHANPDPGVSMQVVSASLTQYNAENYPYFSSAIDNGEVKETIDKFSAEGYALDPGNSYVVEGVGVPEGGTDSIAVAVVNLIMRFVADSSRSFVMISHITSVDHANLPVLVRTSIWSFVPPEYDAEAYDQVHLGTGEDGAERYLWVKEYISPFGTSTDNTVFLPVAWSWKRWIRCVAAESIAGCAAAAILCIPSGPAYPACLDIGCKAAVSFAVIHCTFREWGWA
jgi:hypothetical protein